MLDHATFVLRILQRASLLTYKIPNLNCAPHHLALFFPMFSSLCSKQPFLLSAEHSLTPTQDSCPYTFSVSDVPSSEAQLVLILFSHCAQNTPSKSV